MILTIESIFVILLALILVKIKGGFKNGFGFLSLQNASLQEGYKEWWYIW